MPQIAVLTAIAMIAFAANSLLARQALAVDAIDAAGFTVIRIVSGAAALFVLYRLSTRSDGATGKALPGDWISAAALFGYAILFSLAYVVLGAATGALILFASVQATIIAISVYQGDRPAMLEWLGLGVAFAAFLYLVLPGVGRPDPFGGLLMIGSGLCWGVYTLKGRGSATPLADTAGNFMRASVFAIPFAGYSAMTGHVTVQGVMFALASGVVASGIGYAIWYRVLPSLGAFRAALMQLSVPILAAAGAIALLGEPLTVRFAIACFLVIGGIALAISAKRAR